MYSPYVLIDYLDANRPKITRVMLAHQTMTVLVQKSYKS